MTILVDWELRHIGPDILVPYDHYLVQPCSIDLRLGTTFRTFRHHDLASIDLADVPDVDVVSELKEVPLYKSPVKGVPLNPEGRLVIHPGEMILGSTLEVIRVPSDLVMVLEGKSSLARLGLLPHVAAGYFDAGWNGVGTLELVNLSRVPIILRPGLKICQSRWMRLSGPPTHLYGSAEAGSHYQGATHVDGSRYDG